MRWFLLVGLLLLPTLAHAEGCRLRWYPVERYTNGLPAPGKVYYRIWHQAPGDAQPQELASTDATDLQVRNCQPGEYFLTAHQAAEPQVEESSWSEALPIRQLAAPQWVPTGQGGEPCRVRWTPVRTYTDGASAPGKVRYRVWYQGPEDTVPQALATTDATVIQVRQCKAGEYFVSADQRQPQVQESELSPPLSLQGAAPKR
jgi:hypothetical protein